MSKIIIAVLILILSTACITTGALSQPVKSGLKVTNYENQQSNHVTALHALHLRDFPQEYGGDVITTMPNGSEFVVLSCLTVASGTVWAYGEYVTVEGSIMGWAAARYVSGGCDG